MRDLSVHVSLLFPPDWVAVCIGLAPAGILTEENSV